MGALISACSHTSNSASPEGDFTLKKPLLLHREARATSDVLATLPEGEVLISNLETAPELTSVVIDGRPEQHPWVFVETSDSLSGWIQAIPGYLSFPGSKSGVAWRDTLLLRSILTDDYPRYGNFLATFDAFPQSEASFIELYQEGLFLRDRWRAYPYPDTATQVIGRGNPLPGFLADRSGLWTDWRQWWKLAQRTSSTTDDQLATLFITAVGSDSIEYIQPVWIIVEQGQPHSLLGRGWHHRLLKASGQLIQADSRYASVVAGLRRAVIQDIIRSSNTYWMDRGAILNELDLILDEATTLQITGAERLSIHLRRAQFAEDDGPTAPQINVRAGQIN